MATISIATHYRVFKQIVGVDAAPVFVTSVTDSDYTLSGLTSGQTLKVHIISGNDAGQAHRSKSHVGEAISCS